MNKMNYKIFVVAFAHVGHLNPIMPLFDELKQFNVKTVVYSIEERRELIEKTCAEFRQYNKVVGDIFYIPGAQSSSIQFLNQHLNMFDKTFLQIAKDIALEKPDLVLYDSICYHAKLTFRFLRENQNNVKFLQEILQIEISEPISLPKFAVYTTTINSSLWSSLDTDTSNETTDADLKEDLEKLNSRVRELSTKYNIKFILPLEEPIEDDLNIVLAYPELQPNYERYDLSKWKFVGSCVNTNLRINGSHQNNSSELEKFLDTVTSKRLIYCSFGTVFNQMPSIYSIYTRLIEVFNSNEFKTQNIIISTGANVLEKLNKQIKNGEIKVANNIRLVSSAPQIRVLQNTALFVTHCGFNSLCEALTFAVPMLCCPITADQPTLSNVVVEKKLGLKLDKNLFTVNEAISSIQAILNDPSYSERLKEFSQVPKKYNSIKNFATEIMNYITAN